MLQTTAVGTIGKDAVVNQVGDKKVINFSIAHNEKFTDKDGVAHNRTTWVDCNYWGKNANVAPYLKKGTVVGVTGSISSKGYQRQSGEIASSLELRVERLELVSGKKDPVKSEPVEASKANPMAMNEGAFENESQS
jgi:single-strand DNA-binding protein